MPVFGNRMVVGTANYKHIQEHKAEVDDRETKLGEWEQEKRERLQRIRQLNESTKVSWNLCLTNIKKLGERQHYSYFISFTFNFFSLQRRMSQRSTLSANSDGMRSGSSSRRGSAYTGDPENCTTLPAVTVTRKDSGHIVKDSGAPGSLGNNIIKSGISYNILFYLRFKAILCRSIIANLLIYR